MYNDLSQPKTRTHPDSVRLRAEPGHADPPSPSDHASNRKPVIFLAAAVCVVVIGAVVALAVILYNHPQSAATLRDVFLVLLGIQALVIDLLVLVLLAVIIYVVLKIYDLVQVAHDEVQPIIRRADDMVRTVHSRTVFISDTAVKPVVQVVSTVAAVKSIIRSFTRPAR